MIIKLISFEKSLYRNGWICRMGQGRTSECREAPILMGSPI